MNKVHLVSYPRSGNTWVRFLIANVQHPDLDIGYRKLDQLMPDMHQAQSFKERKLTWSPVVFKSHHMHHDDFEKVIYLYRDGRDVALSCYYFYQGEWNNPEWRVRGSFTEYLKKFVVGWNNFGGWSEHVNFWVIKKIPKVETLFVKYEDLINDPYMGLIKILKFLDIKCTYDQTIDAVHKSSYEQLKARAPGDGQHPFSYGTKGKSGGWVQHFDMEQLKIFYDYGGNVMKKLSYIKED